MTPIWFDDALTDTDRALRREAEPGGRRIAITGEDGDRTC
jgi:hypothetical protein